LLEACKARTPPFAECYFMEKFNGNGKTAPDSARIAKEQ